MDVRSVAAGQSVAARAAAAADDGRLYQDVEGALPRPWVAFRNPNPPDQGALYYHNLETGETKWDRPLVRVQLQSQRPRPAFASWRDHRWQEFSATASGTEANAFFRDFCARLWPRGAFARRGDGVLWRFCEAEQVGLVLCSVTRRLALCYEPRGLSAEDLQAACCVDPGSVAFGAGKLSVVARATALEVLLRALLVRATPASVLADPKAHLVRRYLAEVEAAASIARPRAVATAPTAHAALLARHLRGFGRLLPPFRCRLTGVTDLRDEAEFAAHVLSGTHRQRRQHLRSALRRLQEIDQGEVLLGAWLPAHALEYRSLVQWAELRFQDLPMADGRLLRFDHLEGRAEVTPSSAWFALQLAPPSLATASAQPPAAGSFAASSLWVSQAPRSTRLETDYTTEDLFQAVRRSLLDDRCAPSAAGDAEEPGGQWQLVRNSGSQPYYYNHTTRETTWERPTAIDVGESWATHQETRARDTPTELFNRFHPRPQRPVPT